MKEVFEVIIWTCLFVIVGIEFLHIIADICGKR